MAWAWHALRRVSYSSSLQPLHRQSPLSTPPLLQVATPTPAASACGFPALNFGCLALDLPAPAGSSELPATTGGGRAAWCGTCAARLHAWPPACMPAFAAAASAASVLSATAHAGQLRTVGPTEAAAPPRMRARNRWSQLASALQVSLYICNAMSSDQGLYSTSTLDCYSRCSAVSASQRRLVCMPWLALDPCSALSRGCC